MFVSFCWQMRAFLWNLCTFQRIICIWDKIGYHGNHCEGLLTLCNNLSVVYPNFVNIFWSFLYIWFQLSNVYSNVYNCMCGSDLCTISDWNVVPCTRILHDILSILFTNIVYVVLFISPRLILIQFRIHFELCWYNLSDSGTFLCFLCMYQCIYCIWVILVAMETTVKGYWPSIITIIGVHPNLVTTFKVIPICDLKWEKSSEKSSERNLNCMFSSNLCTIYNWNMVSSTEVLWPFYPHRPTSIAL